MSAAPERITELLRAAVGGDRGADELLYQEIPKPWPERTLRTERIVLPEASEVFREWRDKPDKVPY